MRLNTSDYSSLKKAVSAVYNDDLRQELEEEKNINSFLEIVESLVEEGCDLSEYTYDELYEDYLGENKIVGNIVKGLVRAGQGALKTAWQGTTKMTPQGVKVIPGAKETAKEIVAKVGKAIPGIGVAAGLDQYFTGGKGRGAVGSAIQLARQAGHSIPTPGQVGNAVKPYVQAPTAKPSPSKPYDPWSSVPSSLRQSFDPFDVIKGHLLDEGYADTEESALAIMANMSEDWKQSIIESSESMNPVKED